jgi:alpha-beta hydrolase superfamily lysophospholipase
MKPRRKFRRLRIALGGLLLLCVLFLVGGGCFGEQFILPSNHQTIDPKGARREVVQVEGRTLECWVARSPGGVDHEPLGFILYFVGKGDRADRWIGAVAGQWVKWPVEAWGMNYPGSGGSDGPPRLREVTQDAVGVYDAMRKIAGERPIFVQGGSFGTAAALSVAARRPVAGVVLQNPPPLKQVIMGHYGWWNLWLMAGPTAAKIPADLDSVENATHASAPAVFLLAGSDHLIPPYYQHLVSGAYAGPKRLIDIPGADHDSGLPREAAEQLAQGIDWLWGSVKREK